jgi:hypothetical protein
MQLIRPLQFWPLLSGELLHAASVFMSALCGLILPAGFLAHSIDIAHQRQRHQVLYILRAGVTTWQHQVCFLPQWLL